MLAYLHARAIDGVEQVTESAYQRTLAADGKMGTVDVRHLPQKSSLAVTIRFPGVRVLPDIVARARRAFDLGADVLAIGEHLARHPVLAPLVAARPGLRAPGAWDGFELAVRAVLGQQVSVETGRQLGSRLARLCDARPDERGKALSRAFPDPKRVLAADLGRLGMPASRRGTLVALADAALRDPSLFEPRRTLDETVTALREIRGIGEWTAHYIALRAAREPDAFPASDVGLMRGAADRDGKRPTASELYALAEPWRPWRAYAAEHLWANGARPGKEG
jgi:AraC family transcriptional regulator of adaptative response / DNA-3-methyladenine glycosylase II